MVGPLPDGMPRYPTELSVGGFLRASDYIGPTFFAASGAITAATCGLDLFGCTLIGSMTALGGGTVRDSIILHKQVIMQSWQQHMGHGGRWLRT